MSDRGKAHAGERTDGGGERRDILGDRRRDAASSRGAEGSENRRKRHNGGEESDRQGPPAQRLRRYRTCDTDLLVANIPSSTPLNKIVEHFSRYGEVRHVKTTFSTRTNVMKALVRFKEPGAKEKVAAHQRARQNNSPSLQAASSSTAAPQQTKRTCGGTPPQEEQTATLPTDENIISTLKPPANQLDCSIGKSNYVTPPMTPGSVLRSVKLERSSSFDDKHDVSNTLCELAALRPETAV